MPDVAPVTRQIFPCMFPDTGPPFAESDESSILPRQIAVPAGRSSLALALAWIWWDISTMAISTADAKRRVVLPAASPGDVFDIQSQGEGRLILVRLERPKPAPGMSMARCLEAIAAAPLRPKMTWDSLKTMTREP